jgi:hypothetical protein
VAGQIVVSLSSNSGDASLLSWVFPAGLVIVVTAYLYFSFFRPHRTEYAWRSSSDQRLKSFVERIQVTAHEEPSRPSDLGPGKNLPDVDRIFGGDRSLAEAWVEANSEIHRVYTLIGPPPLPALVSQQR